MNNSIIPSLISLVFVTGILAGGVFLLYAMLKNNLHLIKNALSINLVTTISTIIIYIINKQLFYLPGVSNTSEGSLMQIIAIALLSLLGFIALIGMAYYTRSKYMPLVIIKSSFALSTLIVFMMFGLAFNASKTKETNYSSQNKFVEVDSYSSFNME
jgi:hypothetical protein